MPIYEFYCSACHTLFSFLSRRVRTRKRPDCPRCGKPRIERRPSRFAVARAGRVDEPDEPETNVDETRLDAAMESVARRAEGIREDDPRAMGQLMREFYRATGLKAGEGMQEALRRMELGEDPERIEAELGALLEQEDPLTPGLSTLRRNLRPPAVDQALYEL